MTPQPIPMQIDMLGIVAELNSLGWSDYKIEITAGLGSGYIANFRRGRIVSPGYITAARLWNFWVSECIRVQEVTTAAT